MNASRRLAAVVVADVVGYSRLMEADEAGTVAALKQRWSGILEPLVASHGGRIVKFMGDGALMEFTSAVNAVKAAMALQAGFAAANEALPEPAKIMLRIGINLGDVIGEGSDIYGEGVNIAARLETLAAPGGLCISAKVHVEVQGKIEAVFDDMGEQNLKNIATPIRAYRSAGLIAASEKSQGSSHKPSIAVLPFANMSNDKDQQYFSDGMTEDIITELSRFSQLHVVARNSSFRYRGADLDMIRVGRELGVNFLLEGSIRRMGPRIRITAQLIDAISGHHLWAEKFDRDQNDIFEVQDQVVRTIVATLVGRMRAATIEVAKRKPPASLAAYECVLRADALPIHSPEARAEARALLEKAIALDPAFARPVALLGLSYHAEWLYTLTTPDEIRQKAFEYAAKAAALGENDHLSQGFLGFLHLFANEHRQAEHHFQKSIEANHHHPVILSGLGVFCLYDGRPQEGIEYFKQARILDPYFDVTWYWSALASAEYIARRYEEAVATAMRGPQSSFRTQALLAAICAQLNRDTDARRHAAETVRLVPGFSITQFMTREPFRSDADRQHLIEGLRKAGLPDS